MACRLDGKARMSVDTEINASLSNDKNSNQVTLTISNTNKVDGAMLGYEILRNGQAVGFVNAELVKQHLQILFQLLIIVFLLIQSLDMINY